MLSKENLFGQSALLMYAISIVFFKVIYKFMEWSLHPECPYRSSCPDVFCKEGVLRNFTKFTGKHLCQGLFCNKIAGLRPPILIKKIPWHKCFPVDFVKFLRTRFFTEHFRWLLLSLDWMSLSHKWSLLW